MKCSHKDSLTIRAPRSTAARRTLGLRVSRQPKRGERNRPLTRTSCRLSESFPHPGRLLLAVVLIASRNQHERFLRRGFLDDPIPPIAFSRALCDTLERKVSNPTKFDNKNPHSQRRLLSSRRYFVATGASPWFRGAVRAGAEPLKSPKTSP